MTGGWSAERMVAADTGGARATMVQAAWRIAARNAQRGVRTRQPRAVPQAYRPGAQPVQRLGAGQGHGDAGAARRASLRQRSQGRRRQGQAAAGESEAAAKNGYRAKSFGQWPGARWVTGSKAKKKRPAPFEAVVLSTMSAPTVIELPNASSVSPSKSESESRCCE